MINRFVSGVGYLVTRISSVDDPSFSLSSFFFFFNNRFAKIIDLRARKIRGRISLSFSIFLSLLRATFYRFLLPVGVPELTMLSWTRFLALPSIYSRFGISVA